MKKKKLRLKQSVKLTITGTIFVIAIALLLIKCLFEIVNNHYIAFYFGIGCVVFFALYFVIVIISDAIENKKRLISPENAISQSKSINQNLRLKYITKSRKCQKGEKHGI